MKQLRPWRERHRYNSDCYEDLDALVPDVPRVDRALAILLITVFVLTLLMVFSVRAVFGTKS